MPKLTEPQLAQNTDPFVLSFAGINSAAPYPFIGNGYIGYQVPREGQGINGIPPNHAGGLTLIHGVYTGDARPGEFVHTEGLDIGKQPGLAAVPAWSGFAYGCNGQVYSRDMGEHANYQQSLDMRTGTVTTSDTWTLDCNTTELKTTMFISRADRNRAVIETTISPQFSGEVCFEDILDGSFCTGCDWEATDEDGVMILAGKIGTRQREVLEASRISFSAGEPTRIVYEKTEQGIKRRCFFNVEAGNTYTVRKDVEIYTHQDGADRAELKAKAHAALQQTDPVRLRDEHEQAWADIWRRNIEIPQLPGLQRVINASFYQLVSQLRPDIHNSLGPTGITGLLQWAGRAFWDADLWVGPGILPFHPELGQCIAKYRHRTLQGAFYNAHVRHAFLRLYAKLEEILPQLPAGSEIAQALRRILTESLQRLQEGQAHKGTESEIPLFDTIEEAWRLLENTAESPARAAVATFRNTYADLLVKRDRIKAGEQNVVDNSYGARFAWESAESGCETWFGVTSKQDHINIAVALFQYQYLLISDDKEYRKQAEEVIIECAKYLASRTTRNEAGKYELKAVCGVNESNGIVNNELYTNGVVE